MLKKVEDGVLHTTSPRRYMQYRAKALQGKKMHTQKGSDHKRHLAHSHRHCRYGNSNAPQKYRQHSVSQLASHLHALDTGLMLENNTHYCGCYGRNLTRRCTRTPRRSIRPPSRGQTLALTLSRTATRSAGTHRTIPRTTVR